MAHIQVIFWSPKLLATAKPAAKVRLEEDNIPTLPPRKHYNNKQHTFTGSYQSQTVSHRALLGDLTHPPLRALIHQSLFSMLLFLVSQTMF